MSEIDIDNRYNILFWNCHKNNKKDYFQEFLHDLLKEEEIDLFCLAECVESSDDEIKEFCLNVSSSLTYHYIGCSEKKHDTRMYVFSSLPLPPNGDPVKKQSDRFINVLLGNVEIVFVHLRSMFSTDLSTKIEEDKNVLADIYEGDGHDGPKFFMGDFNSTPYSESLLHSKVFNSVRMGEKDAEICRDGLCESRKRINPSWNSFYKPSLTDSGPLGTYFYPTYGYSNLGWELLDQVVFDEDLSDYYIENSFHIVSSNSKKNLTTVKGRIVNKYSDHLPIVFSLGGA
jgi:hypothetical protein